MATSTKYIYKIAPSSPSPNMVATDSSTPVLPASQLDKTSHFIHMSTSSQIAGTLRTFFTTGAAKDESGSVYLLRVAIDQFSDKQLRWESPDGKVGGTRDGEGLFPHLYLTDDGGEERLWLMVGEVNGSREVRSEAGVQGWDEGLARLREEGSLQ